MNTLSPTFCRAAQSNVPAILHLVQSAYRGDASRAGWTTEADYLDGQRIDAAGILEAIDKPDSYVLLAKRENVILACAHIERRHDECYFGMFAVQPGMQGKGMGKALLAHAEQQASRLWGSLAISMTVIDLRDDLIAWYERRGYARTGAHAPFPYGNERFGIPRRDDLRFEWLTKRLTGSPS
jgi:GNAT superfamily N-acetyltransferase